MSTADREFISNKVHPKIRLNGICPYFTMFPLDFPYQILSKAKRSEIVYDPFCGRGTTNYAARLHGLKSYGVDSNPVAFAIAQSKLIQVKSWTVLKLCREILLETRIREIPEGDFWERAYHPVTLVEIIKLRQYFLGKVNLTQDEIALRAIILGVLHGPIMSGTASYLSNQMPRTFATKPEYSVKYWKQRRMKPAYVDVLELVGKRVRYVFNKDVPPKSGGEIFHADSRNLQIDFERKFDWVVTSPPYFGMSTYEQDQWLRNWFMGDDAKVNYTYESQLKHGSQGVFITDLSKVWLDTATKCKTGADLVIRFGALPSKSESTPSEIIKHSLREANCGWKIKTIRSAGKPIDSKRQANQFKNDAGGYVEEIDVYATLKN